MIDSPFFFLILQHNCARINAITASKAKDDEEEKTEWHRLKEGRETTALTMRELGVDGALISKVTGFTDEEIRAR